MRLLFLHGKSDMFIAVIGRIAFYAALWVHGRVYKPPKSPYQGDFKEECVSPN